MLRQRRVQRCSLRFFSSSSVAAASLSCFTQTATPHATPLPRLLSLLSQCTTFDHVAQAHAFMLARGLDADDLLLSKFIHACSRLGFKDYALAVFQRKDRPDIYLRNTMIRCLCQNDSAEDAVYVFRGIQAAGLRLDTFSFPFALNAATRLNMIDLGREMHGQVVRFGFGNDVHVLTALLMMYSDCGDVCSARMVFDGMRLRDVVLWNAMIAGYVKAGDVDNAYGLFELMPERNVISWTTVISGFSRMNLPEKAIAIFRRMQMEDGIEPDEVALLAVVSACGNLGALDLGEWIHSLIDKRSLKRTTPLMNALIDMYVKSGNIRKGLEIFENMKQKTVVTWTTMIAGLALHGLGEEAIEMFFRMERENIRPNEITFLAVLSACSHIGLTDAGKWCFDIMNSRYKIKPKIQHYGCMIDLLGRAGYLNEARKLIMDMPFEPNAAIWGALLSAARNGGNVEIGEYALRHLIELEPHNSGNYILLSNIYATHEKWEDFQNLRKVMKDYGVQNVPGASSIEVDGEVYEFTSRDSSHPYSSLIYKVLHEIKAHINMLGHAPKQYDPYIDLEEN